MKNYFYFVVLYGFLCCLIVFSFNSCELFKIDNYPEPAETIKGEITDVATGERVYTDQGSLGIRVRLRELSWTKTDAPSNYDFYCMKEGDFQNTKVFAGHYNVRIDGPFIPLVRLNQQGDTLVDESKYVDIKGVTVVNFQVQPFLKIEWVDKPAYFEGGKIRASFKVTRAVSTEIFKSKIEPMGGWNDNFLQVSDVRLYVSESPYVGYNDSNTAPYIAIVTYSNNDFEVEPGFGNTITLTSSGTIPPGRTVFVRAAARIRYTTEGNSRYNYNEAVRVNVPH